MKAAPGAAFIHLFLAFTCTAPAITDVNTQPRIYAIVRFSIPHIIGETNMYEEHTYVITSAGNAPITTGFFL